MNIKSLLKIIIGICVAVFGVVLSVVFFSACITLALGVVGPLLILIGLVMIAVAKE
jgi:hypothetical protein